MNTDWLPALWEQYSLLGSVLTLAAIVVITKVGKWAVFKVPVLHETREMNRTEDKIKWKKDKYPPMVRSTQKVGLFCNLAFYLVVIPFCVTLQAQPLWNIALDVFIILMFYDFLYYLAHRFWFHGNGPMRQIHAVHHQARNPTYLDAHFVHPKETAVGMLLFIGSIAMLALLMGKFHIATLVITSIAFYQLNQINHTLVKLPYFPFKALTWVTEKHHVHHENMHKGNYATITLFYDKIFGTLD